MRAAAGPAYSTITHPAAGPRAIDCHDAVPPPHHRTTTATSLSLSVSLLILLAAVGVQAQDAGAGLSLRGIGNCVTEYGTGPSGRGRFGAAANLGVCEALCQVSGCQALEYSTDSGLCGLFFVPVRDVRPRSTGITTCFDRDGGRGGEPPSDPRVPAVGYRGFAGMCEVADSSLGKFNWLSTNTTLEACKRSCEDQAGCSAVQFHRRGASRVHVVPQADNETTGACKLLFSPIGGTYEHLPNMECLIQYPLTDSPTGSPTGRPTRHPTTTPTMLPTMLPTSSSPTDSPSMIPTPSPTTLAPTTAAPTLFPTTTNSGDMCRFHWHCPRDEFCGPTPDQVAGVDDLDNLDGKSRTGHCTKCIDCRNGANFTCPERCEHYDTTSTTTTISTTTATTVTTTSSTTPEPTAPPAAVPVSRTPTTPTTSAPTLEPTPAPTSSPTLPSSQIECTRHRQCPLDEFCPDASSDSGDARLVCTKCIDCRNGANFTCPERCEHYDTTSTTTTTITATTVTTFLPPSLAPSLTPTTMNPTAGPTAMPTSTEPTAAPTAAPTLRGCALDVDCEGSEYCTKRLYCEHCRFCRNRAAFTCPDRCAPTQMPSTSPPTVTPSALPSTTPTASPTTAPTSLPSIFPTTTPTSSEPTKVPTPSPTSTPSKVPTSSTPTTSPTSSTPTTSPTYAPTIAPTAPTVSPMPMPTGAPSTVPSVAPSTPQPTPQPTFLSSGRRCKAHRHCPQNEFCQVSLEVCLECRNCVELGNVTFGFTCPAKCSNYLTTARTTLTTLAPETSTASTTLTTLALCDRLTDSHATDICIGISSAGHCGDARVAPFCAYTCAGCLTSAPSQAPSIRTTAPIVTTSATVPRPRASTAALSLARSCRKNQECEAEDYCSSADICDRCTNCIFDRRCPRRCAPFIRTGAPVSAPTASPIIPSTGCRSVVPNELAITGRDGSNDALNSIYTLNGSSGGREAYVGANGKHLYWLAGVNVWALGNSPGSTAAVFGYMFDSSQHLAQATGNFWIFNGSTWEVDLSMTISCQY